MYNEIYLIWDNTSFWQTLSNNKSFLALKIPTPFKYQFAAGRRPGGKPDRYVDSQGDEHGTIKGSYTYLDPNYKWQRVRLTKAFILTIIFILFIFYF